jgi:hypothetical protein
VGRHERRRIARHRAGPRRQRRVLAEPGLWRLGPPNRYARQPAPPTETRTWFHLGPIGDAFGSWEEPDFSAEFWPGDPRRLEQPASTAELLQSLPRRDRRDALRVLRGKILRSEL